MMKRGKITPMALAIVLVVGVFIWFLPPAHPCMINAGSMGAIGDEPLHMVGSDCPPPPSTQQLISATEQQCTELNVEWEEWSRKEYTRGMEILDRPTVMYYYELASWSVNHETDMCYMIDVTPAHMFSGERVRVPILQVMDEMDETCFRFIAAEEKNLYLVIVWFGLENLRLVQQNVKSNIILAEELIGNRNFRTSENQFIWNQLILFGLNGMFVALE